MTATTTAGGERTTSRQPSALRVGLKRGSVELRQFMRERDAVVFGLLFPVGLMVLFASIFSGEIENTGVDVRQVFVAGMIAAGIMSTSFQSLAISIAIERDDGTLKRLAGTPMPKSAYFIGKVVLVGVVAVIQTVLLLLIGVLLYGLSLPESGAQWLTFAWVSLLGITSCTLLGIAFSSVPKNGKSAPAIVTPVAIVLQFISGVFFVFSELPTWMQTVAAIFPLKWMTQGMRSVFLPDLAEVAEPAGSWELGRIALILGVWCVVGLVLCVLTFRWRTRTDG